MSTDLLVAEVRRNLGRIVDPCSIATGTPISLEEMGMVKDVVVQNRDVTVTLILTSPICWQVGNIIEAVESAVGSIDGVGSVRCTVDHDEDWLPDRMDPAVRRRLRTLRPLPVRGTAAAQSGERQS